MIYIAEKFIGAHKLQGVYLRGTRHECCVTEQENLAAVFAAPQAEVGVEPSLVEHYLNSVITRSQVNRALSIDGPTIESKSRAIGKSDNLASGSHLCAIDRPGIWIATFQIEDTELRAVVAVHQEGV